MIVFLLLILKMLTKSYMHLFDGRACTCVRVLTIRMYTIYVQPHSGQIYLYTSVCIVYHRQVVAG